MAGKAMPTFSRGDRVKFTDPEKGKIEGEVFRIAAYGKLQQLLIYGKDEKGNLVKAACYNDNATLKKI